jgi:hypothetical protein
MEEHTLFAMRVKSKDALSLVFFLYVCCVQDSKSLNHIVYHKSLDNLTLLLLLYIRRDNKRKEL